MSIQYGNTLFQNFTPCYTNRLVEHPTRCYKTYTFLVIFIIIATRPFHLCPINWASGCDFKEVCNRIFLIYVISIIVGAIDYTISWKFKSFYNCFTMMVHSCDDKCNIIRSLPLRIRSVKFHLTSTIKDSYIIFTLYIISLAIICF